MVRCLVALTEDALLGPHQFLHLPPEGNYDGAWLVPYFISTHCSFSPLSPCWRLHCSLGASVQQEGILSPSHVA